jgi:hypothetical protein
VPRKESIKPGRDTELPVDESGTEPSQEEKEAAGTPSPNASEESRKNGGWREIEAMREKTALKASLADVWDEDFDLDDEILADLDHTAEFFTTQKDDSDESFEEDDNIDEFFEDVDD